MPLCLLSRNVNDGFKINTQSHLVPVLATSIKAVLNKVVAEHCPVESSSQTDRNKFTAKHHSLLLQMLADQLGCEPDDICDFELQACDTQPSIAAGALKEFVFSGRLDNLCMSFCSLKALIDATSSERDLEDETGIQMVALFDHEEVGSNSAQGAGSLVMVDTLLRATNSFTSDPKVLKKAIQRSFLVSADMAHALHPNYMDKHEDNHQPKLHGGLVIKDNANQRYATSAVTSFIFREIAAEHSLPVQDFVVRNDLPCGSTIGPILASGAGIRTVDVGAPQLSMHSIREMCAVDDVEHSFKHFKAFFQDFSHLDAKITVDVPVSLLPCSMDSTSNSATLAPKEFEGYDYDYEGQTRLCFCGLKAPRIMSWSEKDPGRRFFACPIYDPEKKKRQCKYFIWYDQDFSFKAKEVILWLHNTKIKLENELEDARNRIRALKDVLKRHQEKGEQ